MRLRRHGIPHLCERALALIGIGNALLEIVAQLRYLEDLSHLDRLGYIHNSVDNVLYKE